MVVNDVLIFIFPGIVLQNTSRNFRFNIFFGVYVLNENKVNDVATAIHINAIIRVSTVYIPLMRIVIKISQKKALGSIFTEFRNSPMRIPSI